MTLGLQRTETGEEQFGRKGGYCCDPGSSGEAERRCSRGAVMRFRSGLCVLYVRVVISYLVALQVVEGTITTQTAGLRRIVVQLLELQQPGWPTASQKPVS